MKKVILIFSIILLIWIKSLGAGYAEITTDRWAYDPRVSIEVVDHVDDCGYYTMYYCVDDTYVIALERNLDTDSGWITVQKGDYGKAEMIYETDWGGLYESERIISRLVEQALNGNSIGES